MTITVENIDIGQLANDGTGDPLRVAFDKINNSIANLATFASAAGDSGSIQYRDNDGMAGSANLTFDATNNQVNLGANIVPLTNDVSIGDTNNKIANIFLGQNSLKIGNISVTESGNILSFPVSVYPSKSAGLNVGDIIANGNITVANSVTIGSSTIDSITVNTSDTLYHPIYEVPASLFVSGKFTVTTSELNSLNRQTATLQVVGSSNGLTVSYSAYGTIFRGIPITQYGADIAYGNVRVLVKPLYNAAMTHVTSYQLDN
jgi:hypothetical protein